MNDVLGKMVTLEITAPPTSAAARKTLVRLARRDPKIARHQRLQDRHRPSWREKQRGGRFWHHQMRSKPPISMTVGSTYSLFASYDVLRDLESLARFVKVTPQ